VYSTRKIFAANWLCALLVLVPLCVAGQYSGWDDGATFALALAALCPLAERLNFLTEQTAGHTSDALAAILNVTFGNATELIVCIFALKANLLRVLQLSLVGSVMSNCLLVLGFSLFFGGVKNGAQKFDSSAAAASVGMLVVSVLGYSGPMLLISSNTDMGALPREFPNAGSVGSTSTLSLSRYIACVLIILYGMYLWFGLISNNKGQLTGGKNGKGVEQGRADSAREGAAENGTLQVVVPTAGGTEPSTEEDDDDEEDEELELTLPAAVVGLAICAGLTAITSDALVESIEGAALSWKIPIAFISTILLPIVGNATEHASAVMFARHNKLDLSFGIALGSSTQIAAFLLPFCVLLGACMGRPLDLNLGAFETGCMAFTVLLLVYLTAQEGRSHYLRGAILTAAYLMFGGCCLVHKDYRLWAESKAGVASLAGR